ncbi:MAG TPA: condensation domain-containing protein, partial [Ktedonobacteraceae bacterium]|nr:condensation domain-containing protein [Ktedonobacteraceae bacterium]
PFKAETTTAKFDLAVFLFEEPEGLRGTVNYSTDLFEADTIATMMSRFGVLLRNIVISPDTPIDGLEIYAEAEKAQQVKEKKERGEVYRRKLKAARGDGIDLA